MTTLNHIVFDILNLASGGRISDDSKLAPRQIEEWVHQTRSRLLSQDLTKGKEITDEVIQPLGCVELEYVDKSTCPHLPVGCSILRSVKEIPRTIERVQRNTILSVEDLDSTEGFYQTTSFRSKWNKHNKYTAGQSRWYIYDNHLYLDGPKRIKRLALTGIFEDPSEVANFNYVNGDPCWTRDSKYPISKKMASDIVNIILKEKIGIEIQMPTDEINDASGEVRTTKQG